MRNSVKLFWHLTFIHFGDDFIYIHSVNFSIWNHSFSWIFSNKLAETFHRNQTIKSFNIILIWLNCWQIFRIAFGCGWLMSTLYWISLWIWKIICLSKREVNEKIINFWWKKARIDLFHEAINFFPFLNFLFMIFLL